MSDYWYIPMGLKWEEERLSSERTAELAFRPRRPGTLRAEWQIRTDRLVRLCGNRRLAALALGRAKELNLPEAAWVAAAERAPGKALWEAADVLPRSALLAAARKMPGQALGLPGRDRLFTAEELAEFRAAARARRAQRTRR